MTFKPYKKEGIWSYYLRDDSGDSAQCIACKKNLKCGGGSTKGLHTHQKTHGIDILKKAATDTVPSHSNDLNTEPNCSKKRKITNYYTSEHNSLPAILSRMTALDGLPFSIFITSTDLRRCFRVTGHDLPNSANTVRMMVCSYADAMRNQLIDKLRQKKAAGRRFSLSFDEWTSNKNRRYFNVNLHGVDSIDGKQSSQNLGLVRIPGPFSAESCIQALKTKLQQFELDLESDIVSITTDGCSMMTKIGRLITPHQQLCLAHGIHLAVMDTLYKAKPEAHVVDIETLSHQENFFGAASNESDGEDCEEEDGSETGDYFQPDIHQGDPASFSDVKIREVIQKSRNVVKMFKRSPLKNHILQSHISAGCIGVSRELHLILDSKTRWSSLADMLNRIIEVKSALQKSLIDLKIQDSLTEDDFKVVTHVAEAIKPLRAAVEALCRRDSNLLTASAILKFALEDLHLQSTPLSMKLEAAVRKRTIEERTTQASVILRCLHNLQGRLEKKSVVKSYCMKLLTRLKAYSSENADIENNDRNLETVVTSHCTIEERLKEAIEGFMSVKPTVASTGLVNLLSKEISIAEQGGNRGQFLELAYQFLLTVPPTSVEAERVFSAVGFFCTKLRSSLSDASLDSLCFLRFHLKQG